MDLRTEYADTQLALVERGRGMRSTDAPLTQYERMLKTIRQVCRREEGQGREAGKQGGLRGGERKAQ